MADVSSVWTRGGKRTFDVVVCIALLLNSLLLFLVAAGLVKLTSPGPVFFLQQRAGKDGRAFWPWKFRTMRGGRRPDPKELVPLAHPDITPVGRVLRRLKIDELPQLFNVLKGEMSLVGPRPTLPDQAAAYDDFRRQRLAVRPGLTGLAQVNGGAAISWDDRILYDVAYVRRGGLWLDLCILAKTALVLVRGEARMARPFAESPYARYVTPPENYFGAMPFSDCAT